MEQIDDGDGLAIEVVPKRVFILFVDLSVVDEHVLQSHDMDFAAFSEEHFLFVAVCRVLRLVHSETSVSSSIEAAHDKEYSLGVVRLLLSKFEANSQAETRARFARNED